MTRAVTVKVPAKINLSLGVGPVRPDGFHELATVYQAVGLYDRVTVQEADEVTVTVRADPRLNVDAVPTDGSNIAVRAALLLARHRDVGRGVAVEVEKGIPVAGGMAGGSADGAAALLACDHLWDLHTPEEELRELAAELGSDVPFALVGGTAVGSGRGEVVAALTTWGGYWWVVIESPAGLSTPAVYREFDALHRGSVVEPPRVPGELVRALRDHDAARLGAALCNDLQDAALRLRPELRDVLELGASGSAPGDVHGAVVSGSGPTCLLLCASRAAAVRVAEELAGRRVGPVSVVPGPVPGARLVAGTGAR